MSRPEFIPAKAGTVAQGSQARISLRAKGVQCPSRTLLCHIELKKLLSFSKTISENRIFYG